jgi:hypothetical protein
MMLPMHSAGAATTYWANGDVTIYRYMRYFYNAREVRYSPYGIAFKKYDGPVMVIKWWHCDPMYQGSPPQGIEQTVSNSDPAPWVWPKANYSSPTYLYFCLAIMSGGNDSSDSFEGLLDWDGGWP